MKTVTMHQAKTHLSRLVQELADGIESEIIIAKGNVPAARLVPYEGLGERPLGMHAGLFTVPDDFDAPDPEIERLFYGDEDEPAAPTA